jgi:hypothetical protein
MIKRLGGPHNRSGRSSDEKIYLPWPKIEIPEERVKGNKQVCHYVVEGKILKNIGSQERDILGGQHAVKVRATSQPTK